MTLYVRTCITCHAEFLAGRTAKFCPACNADRIRERDLDKYQRKIAGRLRKIGSTDTCQVCGKQYTVDHSNQKYCPGCSESEMRRQRMESHRRAYADPDRREVLIEQNRAWAAAHPDRVAASLRRLYDERRIRLKIKPLGRTEKCRRCGREYTVAASNQRSAESAGNPDRNWPGFLILFLIQHP